MVKPGNNGRKRQTALNNSEKRWKEIFATGRTWVTSKRTEQKKAMGTKVLGMKLVKRNGQFNFFIWKALNQGK